MKIILFVFLSFSVFASEKLIEKAYQEGNYFRVIELTNSKKYKNKIRNYWRGKAFFQLEDYAESIAALEKVIGKRNNNDLLYYYALGNYFSNNYQEAKINLRKYIQISKDKNPKNYFVLGQILKAQNAPKTAKKYFKDVLKSDASSELKQASLYELAQMDYKNGRGIKKNQIKTDIIPQYEKALYYDNQSAIAQDILNQLRSIYSRYKIEGFEKYSRRKAYSLTFSQDFGYDNNILLIPDDVSNAESQNQDSIFSRTQIRGQYRKQIGGRFTLMPSISLDLDHFFDDTDPVIYQNNQYSVTPGFNASYNHNLFGLKTTLFFDFAHEEVRRDYLAEKEYEFFSRRNIFSIGEIFNFYDFGPTIITLKTQRSFFYSDILDSEQNSIVVTQIYRIDRLRKLTGLIGMDNKNAEDDLFDTQMYYLTASYSDKELLSRYGLENYSFDSGGTVLFNDFENQSDVRGLETNLNLFVRVSRPVRRSLDFNVRYNLVKNFSDEENFNYTRHIITSGITYSY